MISAEVRRSTRPCGCAASAATASPAPARSSASRTARQNRRRSASAGSSERPGDRPRRPAGRDPAPQQPGLARTGRRRDQRLRARCVPSSSASCSRPRTTVAGCSGGSANFVAGRAPAPLMRACRVAPPRRRDGRCQAELTWPHPAGVRALLRRPVMIGAIGLVNDRRSAVLARAVEVGHWLVGPLLRFNLIDRSLALGAQAFGAADPASDRARERAERGDSVATDLIERFDLQGDAANVVKEAFTATQGQTTITVFSVVVLVFSVLSFTRRLQRLYEETWDFEPRGLRGTGAGLLWLAFFAAYVSLPRARPGPRALGRLPRLTGWGVRGRPGHALPAAGSPSALAEPGAARRAHRGRDSRARNLERYLHAARDRVLGGRVRLDRRRVRDAYVAVGPRRGAGGGRRLRLAADAWRRS